VALGERFLDPLLALKQPVHRGQELGLLDLSQLEFLTQRRLRVPAGVSQLRPRPQHLLDDHRDRQVALTATLA